MTIFEADAVDEPWFEIATVLAHVCKILLISSCGNIFFEALGAPNATHAMVSAFFFQWGCGPCSLWCASGRPWRTILDRQTLRVCSEIVRGPFWHLCCAAGRLAKRYVCASSAFPVVASSCDSSSWTCQMPPNAAHVMVFAFSPCVRETL